MVLRRPRSVPQCDSVRFIVPDQAPLISFGTNVFFCASVPWVSRAANAPWLKPGYIAKAMFAELANLFEDGGEGKGEPWAAIIGIGSEADPAAFDESAIGFHEPTRRCNRA